MSSKNDKFAEAELDHEEACTLLDLDSSKPQLTKSEIDKAYRAASLSAHPDRGGNAELFISVAAAKALLLSELDTGRRVVKPSNTPTGFSTQNFAPPEEHRSRRNHSWAEAKYDIPSTQSPLSPLRQMGPPMNLGDLETDEIVDLWRRREMQCVWRCLTCAAVCCRIRREKFR